MSDNTPRLTQEPLPDPAPRPPLNLRNWFTRWQRLSWADRLMIGEALFLLGIARATVLLIPFKRVAPYMGHPQRETATDTPADVAPRVANAIHLVSRHTPWNSNCFAQALAAHVMLRRRHAASTLYFGVYKQAEEFAAHAWLRNGDLIVTGGNVHQRFSVIAFYGWQPHKAPIKP